MTEVARTPIPIGLSTKGLIMMTNLGEITFTPELQSKVYRHHLMTDDEDMEMSDNQIGDIFYNRAVLQCLLTKLEEKYGSEYEIRFGADSGTGEYIEFADKEDNEVLKSFVFEYPRTPEVRNARSIFYEQYTSQVSDDQRPTPQEFSEAKNTLLSSIQLVEIDHEDELPEASSDFMRMLTECAASPLLKPLKKAKAVLRHKQTIDTIASEKGLPTDVASEIKSYYPFPKAGTRHKKKKTRKQKKTTRRRRRM